jgi:hypothetical protein
MATVIIGSLTPNCAIIGMLTFVVLSDTKLGFGRHVWDVEVTKIVPLTKVNHIHPN